MAKQITVTDRAGDEFEVEAGIDGKNPVSPTNPAEKSVMGFPVEGRLASSSSDSNSPSADDGRELQKQLEKAQEDAREREAEATGAKSGEKPAGSQEGSQGDQEPPRGGEGSGIEAWREYAVKQGADEKDVENASREELIEKYGSKQS